jgi:hypothetical protein
LSNIIGQFLELFLIAGWVGAGKGGL